MRRPSSPSSSQRCMRAPRGLLGGGCGARMPQSCRACSSSPRGHRADRCPATSCCASRLSDTESSSAAALTSRCRCTSRCSRRADPPPRPLAPLWYDSLLLALAPEGALIGPAALAPCLFSWRGEGGAEHATSTSLTGLAVRLFLGGWGRGGGRKQALLGFSRTIRHLDGHIVTIENKGVSQPHQAPCHAAAPRCPLASRVACRRRRNGACRS